MSAPKFTPGPWRIERCACGSEHCHKYGTSNGAFYQGNGYTLDDARLIAAAPELYEALDALSLIVGLTAFKHEGQRAPLQDAVDAARAALAKARGEA